MNPLEKTYDRVFQTAFKVAIPVLPYRNPKIVRTSGKLAKVLSKRYITKVLLVTDPGITKIGLANDLIDTLTNAHIEVHVYDQTTANPTITNVNEAKTMYIDHGCEAIIGFGGGSSMDCAKGVGASLARPNKPLTKMKGVLKVILPTPLLIAVPTTAGTGSETTLAAVITDDQTHYKYPINDFSLIPSYALLDPKLTESLPPHLTAQTGMDALTHAVEAYIGRSTTKKTRAQALKATKLIFSDLYNAYTNGHDLVARENMLQAAYEAGCAFTVSYVGYCHAVAHSLGGQYGIPHGLANAVLLPYVLKAYGSTIYPQLNQLAQAAGLCDGNTSDEVGAKLFIDAIEKLNASMDIPTKLKGIKKEDIPTLARHAASEGNPLYPVPVLMNASQLEQFYYDVMEE